MGNTIRCVRKLHFCAGHRVLGHEGKCGNIHGHNYYVHLAAEGALDPLGRVIDFSLLKKRIGGWIETHWDHNFLVYEKDAEVIGMLKHISDHKEPFICPFNPTVENIASYLLFEAAPRLLEGTGVTLTKVTLFETENCYAEAFLSMEKQ